MTNPTAKAKNSTRPRLTLLSRSWCHLCEEMQTALEALAVEKAFDLDILDVDTDPRLEERYGEDVPVLLAGSEEICRHRLDRELLETCLVRYSGFTAPQGQIS